MKYLYPFLLLVFVAFSQKTLNAQDLPVHPSSIGTGTFLGVSKPLQDLPKINAEDMKRYERRAKERVLNEGLSRRYYPFASTALPKGPDPVWQAEMGKTGNGPKAPIQNFNGGDSPYYPPDCNGAVGPNHYMQCINCTYQIHSKTGTLLAGPTDMNLLFGSVPGASYNDGDPVILYDEQADRWLATEFSITGATNYILMAVSTTNNPTGTWYQYSFIVDAMPDYPKFSVWRDGYYMADNNSSANDIYVFERSKMITGATAPGSVGFSNPNRPASIDGFMMVPPVDNDGAFAPLGSPGLFIAFNDDAIGGGSDQLWIYELSVNWTTPSSSTFSRVQQLGVPVFDANFGATWNNIAQLGTTQKLDAIPQVIMNAPQYRNFGTYQTIVCCHTVDVDATNHAGIRWYELRRTPPGTTWTLRQSGTYAPDANSRWMGSIVLNGSGQLGLGYSVSSSTIYPGIRYTGQSSAAYNAASGTMDIPEEVIQAGMGYQSGYNRWGDYSNISIDPSNDQTFWFTSEYIQSSARKTKIASFQLGSPPIVITLPATLVTSATATINGSVNPNGLATTYHFDWGTTISYGNTTSNLSAGSGSSAVPVSANLSGLVTGTTYHFRLVATNTDGSTTGADLTFTPGGAVVTTTAASSITSTTASSGGNITTDGGSSVSSRGVCWGTSTNPTISGSHTTDGNGTGAFTSSLTGLSANTLYHIRAYATNGNGTFYGNDLTFTTLCGIVSSFPWTEGFENGGTIPNCWTQEQVNSSGINWTFITGSGNGNPASAHGGTYNACLKDITAADNKTKLITPPINLTMILNPVLTFWHTQATWPNDQDQLTIYYKTTIGGPWTLLITSFTNNITAWTQETINLPNSSSTYYIAFEGNAKYGYGVCVDDVSITGTPALKTLNLNIYVEGYYNTGSGSMSQAQECADGAITYNKFSGTTVDTLSVMLAASSSPWAYVYQAHGLAISPGGTVSLSIPSSFSSNYYIAVKHRQSVETWSANAVSFSGSTINYNFTTAASQAYGNNEKQISPELNIYVLYGGDVASIFPEQDGYIDIFDNNSVYNKAQLAQYGYMVEDITGDGFVDIFDMIIVFNNMQAYIGIKNPPNPGKK